MRNHFPLFCFADVKKVLVDLQNGAILIPVSLKNEAETILQEVRFSFGRIRDCHPYFAMVVLSMLLLLSIASPQGLSPWLLLVALGIAAGWYAVTQKELSPELWEH